MRTRCARTTSGVLSARAPRQARRSPQKGSPANVQTALLRNQMQETAFLVRIVLPLWFLVLDFGVSVDTAHTVAVSQVWGLSSSFQGLGSGVHAPKPNTRNRIFSAICTKNAVSCSGFRVEGLGSGALSFALACVLLQSAL
eukprot:493442-Rhodomonas_salina.1